MNDDRRIPYMDTVRALAILLVVLNHAVEYAWPVNALSFGQLSGGAAALRFSLFTLGRLGVPLFLFLSGALTLSRQVTEDWNVLGFYRRKWLPLLLSCEIWLVVYNLFMCRINATPFSVKALLKKMLFLEQSDLGHMWYMAMLLGVWLAAPFLCMLVKRFSLRALRLPMTVVFLCSFLLPLVNLIRATQEQPGFSTILDLSFLGAHYGFYFVLGYYAARKEVLRRLPGWALFGGFAAGFACTVAFQLYSWSKGSNYSVWYSFPGLLLCGLCLFEGIRRFPKRIPGAETVSRLSLAVFFLHRPIQLVLLHRLPPGEELTGIAVLFAGGALLSLALAALVRLCRPLARVLFLIKD